MTDNRCNLFWLFLYFTVKVIPQYCIALFLIGTSRYEDGKARTGTAVDAGNFRGSRRVVKKKMLKICIFRKGRRRQ